MPMVFNIKTFSLFIYITCSSFLQAELQEDGSNKLSQDELIVSLLGWTEEQITSSRAETKAIFERYTNIPTEDKEKYRKHVENGISYLSKKSYANAYVELLSAEAIFAGDYKHEIMIANTLLQLNLYDEAEEYYLRAISKVPLSINANINIGELYFVSEKYKESLHYFTLAEKVLCNDFTPEQWEKINREKKSNINYISSLDLISFKKQMCYLGILADVNLDANKRNEYEQLFTKLNSKAKKRELSALYYFSNAIYHFNKEEKVEAETWIKRAVVIYGTGEVMHTYVDGFVEFGYLQSFYGGGLKE